LVQTHKIAITYKEINIGVLMENVPKVYWITVIPTLKNLSQIHGNLETQAIESAGYQIPLVLELIITFHNKNTTIFYTKTS